VVRAGGAAAGERGAQKEGVREGAAQREGVLVAGGGEGGCVGGGKGGDECGGCVWICAVCGVWCVRGEAADRGGALSKTPQSVECEVQRRTRGLHSFTSQLNLSRVRHTKPPYTP